MGVRGVAIGAEHVGEGIDGLALEAETETDVGVHAGGDPNMGVTQQLLGHDEADTLLQKQRRGRVPEVVKRMRRRLARLRKPQKRWVRLAGARGRPAGVMKTGCCPARQTLLSLTPCPAVPGRSGLVLVADREPGRQTPFSVLDDALRVRPAVRTGQDRGADR